MNNNFEDILNKILEGVNEKNNVTDIFREHYDLLTTKLFPALRKAKLKRAKVLSQILNEMGIENISERYIEVIIQRLAKERGELSARDKRKALLMGSKPQNQVITTAPKVNDNAIKGVFAPSVIVDTVKTSNKALETIKNDSVGVSVHAIEKISPEVLNLINPSDINNNLIDSDTFSKHPVHDDAKRYKEEFVTLYKNDSPDYLFNMDDLKVLKYFTYMSFKEDCSVKDLGKFISEDKFITKDFYTKFKNKCLFLKFDLSVYGKK